MESPRYSRTNKATPTQLTAHNTNSMTMETIGFLMIADKIKYNMQKIWKYLFADCLGTLKESSLTIGKIIFPDYQEDLLDFPRILGR